MATPIHRLRPALSKAARAKRRIVRLEREISAAGSDQARVDRLRRDRAWEIVNSLIH